MLSGLWLAWRNDFSTAGRVPDHVVFLHADAAATYLRGRACPAGRAADVIPGRPLA